jgi:hypothetical protein
MRKIFLLACLALVFLPGIAMAQTKGCGWDGDPSFRYGWNSLDKLPFNQPGPDYADIYAGGSITREIGPYNSASTWLPSGCKGMDTLCCHVWSKGGWTINGNPALDQAVILPGPGYLWYQNVTITAPCGVTVCDYDTVIAQVAYWNTFLGACDPACGDCHDPNIRPTDGLKYYSKDTLIIHVVEAPPALAVFQDTLTLVARGQSQSSVPFSICNQDPCAPSTEYAYHITSRGHIGAPINTTNTVSVPGGDCKDVYGVIDAGSALSCTYDTLTIIAWSAGQPVVYDTCVQVVHCIESCCVPVFTSAVGAILILALVLAAAFFTWRRVARAV